MLESRAFVRDIGSVKTLLDSLGAKFIGNYSFTDIIYSSDQSNDFVRIRVYEKNNWGTKNIVVVHKKSEWFGSAKKSELLSRSAFDNKDTAEAYVVGKFPSYKKSASFFREGSQYDLDGLRIFVEQIESLGPSVEAEAETQRLLDAFFEKLDVVSFCTTNVAHLIKKK